MSVSVLSKFRPGGPIEGVSDAEPAGETSEGLGGIQASALAEPDASWSGSRRGESGCVFEWIDDGMVDEFEDEDVELSGRNKAVDAVCVGITPGP